VPPLQIRRAKLADAPFLRRLAALAYAPYVDRMEDGQRPAPMDENYVDAIEHEMVWVASLAGKDVGFVVCAHQPEHILLKNVAVDPQWHGRGVGRELIGVVESEARALGSDRVHLYTNVVMTESQRLYEHLGYVEVARRSEHGFERVFYEKLLIP
jgi:ribosomal protein S18 acetylase RimI-like enzyme